MMVEAEDDPLSSGSKLSVRVVSSPSLLSSTSSWRGDNTTTTTTTTTITMTPSLDHLSRTTRWKVQFGLYKVVPNADVVDETSITEYNASRSLEQKERVQELMTKHMWKNSPLALIESLSIHDETIKQETINDPLSAFAREQEQTTATSNDVNESSGWNEFYSNRETIDLIYKDLNRLSPRLVFLHPGEAKEEKDDEDPQQLLLLLDSSKVQRRNDRLRILADILFCYAKEHPELGYRQGMHEILAHVFLALQLDGHTTSSNIHTNTADDDIKKEDAYLLFEAWMEGLKVAYDSSSSTIMGDNILLLLKKANLDIYTLVFSLGENMGAPPQLYVCKWIRLLFSREIHSILNVLQLWDTFLNILYDPIHVLLNTTTTTPASLPPTSSTQKQQQQQLKLTLLDIVESAACSMILLQRKILLSKKSAATTRDNNNNIALHDCLSHLMNYPCMNDITDFEKMTQRVLRYVVETRLGIKTSKTTSPSKGTTSTTSYSQLQQQHQQQQQGNITINNHTVKQRQQQQHDSSLSFVSNVATAFSGVTHHLNSTYTGADPMLSRVGTFLGGVKASAQNVIATLDEQLQQQQQLIRNKNKNEARQDKLLQLALSMEADIIVLKEYITIETTKNNKGTNDNIPKEVLVALEGLEHIQRDLVLYGSK